MMVVDRLSRKISHKSILDLPKYLRAGDVLVVNDTKVLPVRLFGKKDTGGEIEVVLLRETEKDIWEVIATRTKRLKPGTKIKFGGKFSGEILERRDDKIIIKLFGGKNIYKLIEKYGVPPLPPYIERPKKKDYSGNDIKRYQTVYAKNIGSAAAPTAGFHLTKKLIAELKKRGVKITHVTLHVGLDTFSPVRVDNIHEHKMHGEEFFVPEETAETIAQAKKNGHRVIAVGTTSVRALESFGKRCQALSQTLCIDALDRERCLAPFSQTTLFITPGYNFRVVDAILTNFHQPRSTLIMMISAFAGREFILGAYKKAISNRYRLFSFGDCMLIS